MEIGFVIRVQSHAILDLVPILQNGIVHVFASIWTVMTISNIIMEILHHAIDVIKEERHDGALLDISSRVHDTAVVYGFTPGLRPSFFFQ